MAQPLEVRVPMSRVTPKKPARKGDNLTPSLSDKVRWTPKPVTNKTKSPLEVGAKTNTSKSATVERMSMVTNQEAIPLTKIGYPRRRFNVNIPPNTPQ